MPVDKKASIQLLFEKKEGNHFDIRFRVPKEYVAIVREAIMRFLEEMPITTRQAFEALLDRM